MPTTRVVEIPRCTNPAHAGSRVIRYGWYGKAPHRRQRWLCTPGNGDPPHRFTPVLTRQGHPHGFCLECSTALEPWEGQAGAREYQFAAREVGHALARVAAGDTYRHAAWSARRLGERVRPARPRSRCRRRSRDPARDGQLVANWVDVFTPLLVEGELPNRWPDLVIVDSMQFRVNSGARAGLKFNVLAAVGSEASPPGRWREPPKVIRIEPFPTKSRASWVEFFSALEGTPRVVMTDADVALDQALRTVFPRAGDAAPELRLSEWHIQRMIRAKLPAVVLDDVTHPIGQAFRPALLNPVDWRRFEQAVRATAAAGTHGPLITAINFLDSYGPRIAAQSATRERGLSHSTSPAEAVLRQVDRRIGDRVGSFTNRARMAKLLQLIALDLRGQADERRWADRLRERLYLAGGRPATHQRSADDPKGAWSLLA